MRGIMRKRLESVQKLGLVRTESGESLDARFQVAPEEGEVAIYLESRSGPLRSPHRRNPDYNQALWYILARLAASEGILLEATVESTETSGLPLEEKRLAISHPYPVTIAAHDPSELRLQLTRAQRTIGRPEGAGPGGNITKRIRLLVSLDQAMPPEVVRELLISGSIDPLRDAIEAVKAIAGRRPGQGFATDSASKKVVEDHAMDTARRALESEGWSVKDVSRERSYDFECRRNDDELRVEVKGTRGGSGEILVTANEVQHAREHGAVALAIVSAIAVHRGSDGKPIADGGQLTWHRPWSVDQGKLVPLAYSWSAGGRNS